MCEDVREGSIKSHLAGHTGSRGVVAIFDADPHTAIGAAKEISLLVEVVRRSECCLRWRAWIRADSHVIVVLWMSLVG